MVLRRKKKKRNQPVFEIYSCPPICSRIKKNCWCQVGQVSCELIGFSAKGFISQEISGHHYHVKILCYPTYVNLSRAYIRGRREERDKQYGKGVDDSLPFGDCCRTGVWQCKPRVYFGVHKQWNLPWSRVLDVQGFVFPHFSSVMFLKQICGVEQQIH